ncbi:MAG: hypothetical protein ABIS47_14760 [Acidimicrobiales bacterium]
MKELKAAGRRDHAATVAALRRPTKQAWALGEAVRRAPAAADAFLAAVADLADSGGDPDLRRRTIDLRAATRALVEAAEGADPGEVAAGLLAVAADPAATEALRRGRLAEVPTTGGFGGLALGPAGPAEADGPAQDLAPTGRDLEHGPDGQQAEEAAEQDRRRAERDRLEGEARSRAERLASLEAARDEAVAAEGVAVERVQAAQAALDLAQAALDQALTSRCEVKAAAAAAAERVLAAELGDDPA